MHQFKEFLIHSCHLPFHSLQSKGRLPSTDGLPCISFPVHPETGMFPEPDPSFQPVHPESYHKRLQFSLDVQQLVSCPYTEPFAQIVICGECGEMFRRIHWNNRGCKSIVWRYLSRLEPTGLECHARTVNETVLENVVVQAINALLGDKSTYQAQLQQNIAKVIKEAQKSTSDGIDEQLMELQK